MQSTHHNTSYRQKKKRRPCGPEKLQEIQELRGAAAAAAAAANREREREKKTFSRVGRHTHTASCAREHPAVLYPSPSHAAHLQVQLLADLAYPVHHVSSVLHSCQSKGVRHEGSGGERRQGGDGTRVRRGARESVRRGATRGAGEYCSTLVVARRGSGARGRKVFAITWKETPCDFTKRTALATQKPSPKRVNSSPAVNVGVPD